MSIQPKPNRLLPAASQAVQPGSVYFLAERAPTVALRPLTALDQMFAYWGSDLAA